MSTRSFLFGLGLGLAIGSASSAPTLRSRSEINWDAVVGFPETAPAGSPYLKYKPYLDVVNGCVSFPAVDADGNTG